MSETKANSSLFIKLNNKLNKDSLRGFGENTMYINFGNYPQGADGKKSPIEWLVLEDLGDEVLVLSRYGLDCKKYHHKKVNVTWEQCDLREWLNNDFLKAAFSEEEIKRIKVSELKTKYGTDGENSTKERVFCLSIEEAKRYFKNNEKGQCNPTDYARNQGTYVDTNSYCFWWLRSPGFSNYHAAYVDVLGVHNEIGVDVDIVLNAVRPALRIIK